MTPLELRELLARLHAALAATPSLDAETARLAAAVQDDLARLRPADELPGAGQLPALERIAVHFESDHPAVARAARALIDALGKAGI